MSCLSIACGFLTENFIVNPDATSRRIGWLYPRAPCHLFTQNPGGLPTIFQQLWPVRILCKVEGALQTAVAVLAVPRHWLAFGISWLLLKKKRDLISFTEITEFSTSATFCMGIGGYSHVTGTKGSRTQVGGLAEDRMLGRQHHLMAAGQSLYHHLENIGCYFFILMSFSYSQNRHLCYYF